MQITIVGGASKRVTRLEVKEDELEENLLKWLRKKGITIASSCDGEGVCKKCVIQNNWLTCELSLKMLFERQPDGEIIVSYL